MFVLVTGFGNVLMTSSAHFRLTMPESPRWLMVAGKNDELRMLLKRICKVNGSSLPADFDPSKIELVG